MPPFFTPRDFLSACPRWRLRQSETAKKQLVGHNVRGTDLNQAVGRALKGNPKVDNWTTISDTHGSTPPAILIWVATEIRLPDWPNRVLELTVRLDRSTCLAKVMAVRPVQG